MYTRSHGMLLLSYIVPAIDNGQNKHLSFQLWQNEQNDFLNMMAHDGRNV